MDFLILFAVSLIVTWSIGLGLPALVRFIFYRRQLQSTEAVVWAIGLGLFEAIFFITIGTENKTHRVLILIGWIAYRMLQTTLGPFDNLQFRSPASRQPEVGFESTRVGQDRQWWRARLNTPWKRIAFLPLVVSTIVLVATLFLPFPVIIEESQFWYDGNNPNQQRRTVHRLDYSCATGSLGFPSFRNELEIAIATDNVYYELLMNERQKGGRVPEFIDLESDQLESVKSRLLPGKVICVNKDCAYTLTLSILEDIVGACAKPVIQSLKVGRYTRIDFGHLRGREELILGLFAVAALSCALSVLYEPTIGRLAKWIRHG